MESLKMKDISQLMRKMDICMMTTQDGRGTMWSRPMSNNGDVEYDGNSWFFTFGESVKVKQLENHPLVNLNFTGKDMLYISVTGNAKLIRQKASMQEHWLDELKQWFPEGLDTPGIVMIHVEARHIRYWQKEKEGELVV